jgi:hypothetical protein
MSVGRSVGLWVPAALLISFVMRVFGVMQYNFQLQSLLMMHPLQGRHPGLLD